LLLAMNIKNKSFAERVAAGCFDQEETELLLDEELLKLLDEYKTTHA
jgi:hypothetical protein